MNNLTLVVGIAALAAAIFMALNGYGGLYVASPVLILGVLLSLGVVGD